MVLKTVQIMLQYALRINQNENEEMWSREIENQLQQAIAQNDLARVKAIIATGDIDFFAVNNEEETFLLLAARLGEPGILQFLLTAIEESLADHSDNEKATKLLKLINTPDKENETPLLGACEARNRENILLLLKCGAFTYLRTNAGYNFFSFITFSRDPTFSQLDDDATLSQLDNPAKRGDEIRQRVLTEHRYYMLCNPENTAFFNVKVDHLRWANQLSLRNLAREKLWLSKKPFAFTEAEKRLVYAHSDAKLETGFYTQGFMDYLKERLVEINDRYISVNWDSMSGIAWLDRGLDRIRNFFSMPLSFRYKPDKSSIFIHVILFLLHILVGLAIAFGALMATAFVLVLISGGGIVPAIIGGLAAFIAFGAYTYKACAPLVESIIPPIKKLHHQHKLLNETIADVLPFAKALLSNLASLKDENLQAIIDQLIECIRYLEQGGGIFDFFFDSRVVDKLAELAPILEANTKYFFVEEPQPSPALLLIEENKEEVVLEMGKKAEGMLELNAETPEETLDEALAALPKVVKNPSPFFAPVAQSIQEKEEQERVVILDMDGPQ